MGNTIMDGTLVARQVPSSSSASNSGSHRGGSNSLSSIIWTICAALLVAGVLIGGFFFLRSRMKRLYAPRTFHEALDENEKTPAASGKTGWLQRFKELDDSYVLSHGSLDGYLYLRFFRMLTIICFVGCCITWPILFPVNATGGGGEQQLDLLSFSNVANPVRYYAHTFVAWIFLGFIMFLITRETMHFIKVRQAYLLSMWNASRLSARVVLFTSVPGDVVASEEPLREMFRGVRTVWIPTDCERLQEMVDDRDDAFDKLEKAEVQLSAKAIKRRRKDKNGNGDSEQGTNPWMLQKDRPTHRLKPVIGSKVDTIDWARQHLSELLPQIKKEQELHRSGKKPRLSAAIVEFETLGDAETAFASVPYHAPTTMNAQQIGVMPGEIIWKNMGMSSAQASIRMVVVTAIITLLIMFWGIPTAFVGAVTNINYLTQNVPFLGWIDSIPSWVLGAVTGLFPTIFLALLMVLVPIICRFLAKQGGLVTLSQVELKTQSWYFVFQVIQVFLITTFTSGAAAVASQIVSNPTSAVTLLAQNLPKASNFYISYFVLYGVAMSANFLLNAIGLLTTYGLARFTDKTPRKMYNRYMSLAGLGWGSVYPKFTNLAVIAISYSCIAPLVLGFATIGLGLLYLVYRHNFLYVYDNNIDTKGMAYAKALQQLTVGVYLAEFCLIGLFAKCDGDMRHRMNGGETESNGTKSEADGKKDRAKGWFKMDDSIKLAPCFEHFADVRSSEDAYCQPCVATPEPIMWIARDDMGISRGEIEATRKVLNATDEHAWFDEKGKVVWDRKVREAPLWEDEAL